MARVNRFNLTFLLVVLLAASFLGSHTTEQPPSALTVTDAARIEPPPEFPYNTERVREQLADLLAQLRAAGIERDLPVDFDEVTPLTGTWRTTIDNKLLQAEVDEHGTSVYRSIILVDGNFRANGLNDSIVVATGQVSFTTSRNSIVIASNLRGNTVDAARGGQPTLLVSQSEVRFTSLGDAVVHAGEPVRISRWARQKVTLVNTDYVRRPPHLIEVQIDGFEVPFFKTTNWKQPVHPGSAPTP